MSVVEETLVEVLTDDQGISGLVGSRVYPLVVPQGSSLPAIAYQRISGPRVHSHNGASGLAHPRFQFACVAQSYSGAKALANAVRAALDGYRGTMIGATFVENEVDQYNESPDRKASTFTVWVDAVVWHREGF